MLQVHVATLVFTGLLLVLIVTERILHVSLMMFSRFYSSSKHLAGRQVLVSEAQAVSEVFGQALTVFSKGVFYLISWWLLIAVSMIFLSIVYVSFEETPQVWVGLVKMYNVVIGPWVSQVFVIPLYVVNLFVKALLPFWNAFFWFLKQLLAQGLLPLLLDEIKVLINLATVFVLWIEAIVNSIVAWIQAFDCIGAACLQPEVLSVNVITPMGYFKESTAYTVQLIRKFCSFVAVPLDIFIYPIMDFNLALWIHNLVNAVVYFLVGIPFTTVKRCALASDNTFHIMMCTPDFNPVFQYLVASFTAGGQLMDNWVNIILVIVQEVLTGTSPVCDQIGETLVADLLSSDVLFARGSSRTIVIGLTAWMYAVTDGSFIVYKGHSSNAARVNQFPYSVDTRFGIAAVSFSKTNSIDVTAMSDGSTNNALQTTALLGCNCTDTSDKGMQITCAIAPLEGWESSTKDRHLLRVLFPNNMVKNSLKCAWTDIHVKTNRFSYRRYSSADINYGEGQSTSMPTSDCMSRGTCQELDATIWVVPRCEQDIGQVIEACIPGSDCFPYCMGARVSGSTNNNIVLSSASQWKRGRTLLNVDCNIYQSTPYRTSNNNMFPASVVQAQGDIMGSDLTASIFSQKSRENPLPECYPLENVITTVENPGYRASVYNTYSNQQPFVITGDVLFTRKDRGGGVYSVVIDRLQGDQKNEFQMSMLTQDFPAEPPPNVPLNEADFRNEDRLLLPYSTRIQASVAVSSRNYVFYASNPDYTVFAAYFDYCTRDPSKMPRFGLIITSSYGPIRIYRVKAYVKCAGNSCGAGLIKSIDFDGFKQNYDKKCDGHLNTSIVSLEYLNEDNIAVVVSESPVNSWDTNTATFTTSTRRVYWLNPATMKVSDKIWQTTVATGNIGVLCPGMQRLPRIGSFGAELWNAGIYLVEYVVSVVTYTPGIMRIWLDGGRCPQMAYGHSMLENCGQDFLSLDNFFDSLADAGSIFWHSLNYLVYAMQIENNQAVNPITDIISGMALYGEATVDVRDIRGVVVTLTNAPFKAKVKELWGSLQSGELMTAMGDFQGNTLVWARFIYKVGAELVTLIVKNSMQGKIMTSNDVYREIWTSLYNVHDYYKNTVSMTNLKMCSGVRLMFGVDNPIALSLMYACQANVLEFDSVFDMLLDITIRIPMTVCLCKESRERNVVSYVTNKCASLVPLKLRPQLYLMGAYVQEQSINSIGSNLCNTALDYTRNKIVTSMDPFFNNLYNFLTHFGDCIDYLLIVFDANAGKCSDFQGNPHVVSIIPQPMDYFQTCSKTSNCKMKCASEWALFKEVKTQPILQPTISVSYESVFFPGEYDNTMEVYNVSAVLELDQSMYPDYCTVRGDNLPEDYVIMVTEVFGRALQIKVWCVPQAPQLPVYVSSKTPFASVTMQGDIMQSFFVDHDNLALIIREGSANQVWLYNRNVGDIQRMKDFPVQQSLEYVNVLNIWPLMDSILVDVVFRRMEITLTQAIPESYVYHFLWDMTRNDWIRVIDPDLSTFAVNYLISRVSTSEYKYILFPQQPFLPVYYLTMTRGGYNNQQIIAETGILASFDPNQNLPELTDAVLSSRVIQNTYLFAVVPTGWDWLRQVRFSTTGLALDGVKASTPVKVNVTTQARCDERSCEGCPSLYVQRICQAYNKCALTRCIGTLVNQMRPLCAVGQTLVFHGHQSLTMYQGAWVVIAEMLATTLKLSLNPGNSLNVEWPDDVFMGFICNAKDFSTEFFAILTSVVNALMHYSVYSVEYSTRGSGVIDRNIDASYTIRATSLNAFLSHFMFLPIYNLIALKQIVMCQVNGVLGLMDVTGYSIRIQSAEMVTATDKVAGRCLVLSAEEAVGKTVGFQNISDGPIVVNFLTNALDFITYQAIDPFVHIVDSYITYLLGIFHTLGTLIMSFYQQECNPPDYFLTETVQCACGDYRLSIPDHIAQQGVNQYALWCSGSLSMIDSTNTPIIVANPYTFHEIRTQLAKLDDYVKCVATSYNCEPEGVDPVMNTFFEAQDVSLVNVFVKCRENYMKKQWDPRAFAYFDINSQYMFAETGMVMDAPSGTVKDCLLQSHANGAGPLKCMEDYINSLNFKSSDEYWVYEKATKQGSQYTDSCLVFSGPAMVKKIPAFQACLDVNPHDDTRCSLNAQIWSADSDNDVPVAEQHIILYDKKDSQQTSQDQLNLIQSYYDKAHQLVTSAVLEAIYAWGNESNPDVQVDFFSTEGDAIHQILDCIFMGPYSRVDYWPIPLHNDNGLEAELKGPTWYRDETKGKTRNIDVNTCPSTETMPFTCGSQPRRAAVKYFVKNMLSGNRRGNGNKTLIQKVVLEELRDIYRIWNNKSHYGCECSDGSKRVSTQCCLEDNSTGWISYALAYEFQELHADNVLDALEDEYEAFYNLTLQDMYPWLLYNPEKDEYNWDNNPKAKREGLMQPTEPAFDYNNTLNTEVGIGGLWGICHASLKQIFFTLPVKNNQISHLSKLSEFNGDPTKIDETIRDMVQGALEHSPTYRHYYARYHPSSSLMCKSFPHIALQTPDTLDLDGLLQAGQVVLESKDMLTNPVQIMDYENMAVGAEPVSSGTTSMFQLSPHWGILNESAQLAWMRRAYAGVSMSARDILRYGRGGVVLGNIDDINNHSTQYINENDREIPLSFGAISQCDYDARNNGQIPVNPTDILEELFPVSMAAQESAVASYCLRYFIEKARFTVLDILANMSHPTAKFMQEYLSQQELMYSWEKKCGSQAYLLHLCTSLQVFGRPLVQDSVLQQKCIYFQPENSPNFYTTPECLAYIDGEFYDPCRCMLCEKAPSSFQIPKLDKAGIKSNPQCKLRFNPISKGNNPDAPIGWWEGESIPFIHYLNHSMLQAILEDADAVGNTPHGGDWKTSEGFMKNTGVADECDMMTDYWPDDQVFPVGYHVSTTCEAEDNAYRSFSSAFVHTVSSTTSEHKIQYTHDSMRNSEDIDSLYGVNGLCRQNNFGMNMKRMNTMVYCTKTLRDIQADFTVPGFNNFEKVADSYTMEHCSRDNQDTPWDGGNTLGTVPHLPFHLLDAYYPNNLDTDMFDIGNTHMQAESWGSTCQHPDLMHCTELTPCPLGYTCRGRRCSDTQDYQHCESDIQCSSGANETCKGVCLPSTVDCIMHKDCDSLPTCPDCMCNGLGQCVSPGIVVFNENTTVEFSMQFQAYGEIIPNLGNPYTLTGASYWGYMGRDLLAIHGMCSYDNWYKYKEYYLKQCVVIDSSSNPPVCWIDPSKTHIRDITAPEVLNASNLWWSSLNGNKPSVMYIRPTVCDKDYEHLANYTFYQPLTKDLTFVQSGVRVNVEFQQDPNRLYDNYTRAYVNHTMSYLPLAMINTSYPDYFIYGSALHNYLGENHLDTFQTCNTFKQCLESPFTKNFVKAKRTVLDNGGKDYKRDENFICGAIGFINKDKVCQIDRSVFPLYDMFCLQNVDKNSRYWSCVQHEIVYETIRSDICRDISDKYEANYLTIKKNVAGLNQLLMMFNGFVVNEFDIMKIAQCANDMYSYMSTTQLFPTKTLYYAFPFVLKEIPYDFFYQCMVLVDNFNFRETVRVDQACSSYKEKADNIYSPLTTKLEPPVNYLRKYRAGFTMANFELFRDQSLQEGLETLETASTVIKNFYISKNDQTRPICSKYRTWKKDLTDIQRKFLENWYDSSKCKSERNDQILQLINSLQAFAIFSQQYDVNETAYLMFRECGNDLACSEKRINTSYTFDNFYHLMSETFVGTSTDIWISEENRAPSPHTLMDYVKEFIQSNWGITLTGTTWQRKYDIPVQTLENITENVELHPNLFPMDSKGVWVRDTLNPICVWPNEKLPECKKMPKYSHVGAYYCHYHYIGSQGEIVDRKNPYEVFLYIYNQLRKQWNLRESLYHIEHFDFFKDTDWQTSWQFNFADELDYMANNQPDTSRSVMCVVSDEKLIDFAKCNHPHWIKLKKHSEERYYKKGAVNVPPDTQMHWQVSKSLFVRGFITSWRSNDRNDDYLESYIKKIFDEGRVCGNTYTTNGDFIDDQRNKVCYKVIQNSQEKIGVVNPWLHGFYNPYEQCDVKYSGETIDSSEFFNTYMYPQNPNDPKYPPDMPNGATCSSQFNKLVDKPSPVRFDPNPIKNLLDYSYNLCHHRLLEYGECQHDQGLLGNDDGMPVGIVDASYNQFYNSGYDDEYAQYKAPEDMYTYGNWKIPEDFKQGLFGDTNPLWKGFDAIVGHLQVPDTEIGVHTIGMTLFAPNTTSSYPYSTLYVTYLPLGEFDKTKFMSLQNSSTVDKWVTTLIEDILEDHRINEILYDSNVRIESDQSWSVTCPLKWYTYYGRWNTTAFRPITPSPAKTKYMFARINRGTSGHPTMNHVRDGRFFGGYQTVNGFCFCPVLPDGTPQVQCKIPIASQGTCSLHETIQTLKGKEGNWYKSHVFSPIDREGYEQTCSDFVDWPHTLNSLRDHSLPLGYTDTPKRCHMLERLPPFWYRYKNTKNPSSTTKNTVKDGVCKTSRLSSISRIKLIRTSASARCVKLMEQSNFTEHQCETDATIQELPRPTVLTEHKLYEKYIRQTRMPCSRCSNPPTFVDSGNTPIQAESSFGKAYKVSVTSMLMRDLRRALLDGNVSLDILDNTYWTRDLFLRTYLQTPEKLVKSQYVWPKPPSSSPYASKIKEDASKWQLKPWVYCPSVDSLKNGTGCVGSISKKDWIKEKTKMCPTMIKYYMQETKQDPMSHASFANIDKYTNKVAQAIQQAREFVITGNCIASGNAFCLPQPFTYHPASYETTNRAWIHDTVVQYYKSIDSNACPATSETALAFREYLKTQQLECPANNVYLFESILRIIRTYVTYVSILISNLVLLLGYLIATPFSATAESMLAIQWAKTKKIFHALFSSTSNLVVNMVMNSGKLGKYLGKFIKEACEIFNTAYVWFTDIWCKYVKEYLTTFYNFLRKTVGAVQDGLMKAQELFNFLMRYYLPASFIMKYGTTALQARMMDKFGEPTDNADRNKAKNQPVKSAVMSKGAKFSTLSRMGNSIGNTMKNAVMGIGFKSLAKTGALAAFMIGIDLIMNLVEDAMIPGLVDKLWVSKEGMFNFESFYDAADNLVYFLISDERCITWLYYRQHSNNSGYMIQCPNFDIDPTGSDNPSKSISPTMCWASSNPSLGESSAYSCTASSTCCPASGCSSDKSLNVICGECPFPNNPGISRFACDNMMCRCGVPVQITSQCQSNDACSISANSFCDLVTSLTSTTIFGTLPCNLCRGRTMCIAQANMGGGSGRCGCVMDQQVYTAQCFESPGTLTFPNPNMLCGYLPRLSDTSTQSTFQYRDIMSVMCSLSRKTICARVYMDNGVAVNMPVSYVMRLSNSRRRLLFSASNMDDEEWDNHTKPILYSYENEYDSMPGWQVNYLMSLPHWNITSAPCSTLSHAYQTHPNQLTILEMHELRKCAYWRWMGQDMIRTYNLTSLKNFETFLVSMDDLSKSLTMKNVLWDFLAHPLAIWEIMLMNPYLKPIRALVIVLLNIIESLALTGPPLSHQPPNPRRELEPIPVHQDNPPDNTPDWLLQYMHKVYWEEYLDHQPEEPNQQQDVPPNTSLITPSNKQKKLEKIYNRTQAIIQSHKKKQEKLAKGRELDISKYLQHSWKKLVNHNNDTSKKQDKPLSNRRKLLATFSDIQAIQQYSSKVIKGEINTPIALTAAQSWLRGPFTWPPTYDYSFTACPIVVVVAESALEIFSVTALYFRNFDKPPPPTPKSLRANLPQWWFPQISLINSTTNETVISYKYKTWAGMIYYNVLNIVNIQPYHIENFLIGTEKWSLLWIFQSAFQCDFASIMTCSRRDKDLFMSIIVFIMLYLILRFVCSALAMESLATLFLIGFIPFILWYTYGISIFCLPMLPTCLIDDMISLVYWFLPISVSIPQELYCRSLSNDTITNTTLVQLDASCIQSCTTIGFTEWWDPLVYSLCSFDSLMCYNMVKVTNQTYGYLPGLHSSTTKWFSLVTDVSRSQSGHRLCTLVTWIQVMPFLFFLFIFTALFSALVYALLALIPTGIRMLSEVMAFTHTK